MNPLKLVGSYYRSGTLQDIRDKIAMTDWLICWGSHSMNWQLLNIESTDQRLSPSIVYNRKPSMSTTPGLTATASGPDYCSQQSDDFSPTAMAKARWSVNSCRLGCMWLMEDLMRWMRQGKGLLVTNEVEISWIMLNSKSVPSLWQKSSPGVRIRIWVCWGRDPQNNATLSCFESGESTSLDDARYQQSDFHVLVPRIEVNSLQAKSIFELSPKIR